MALSALYKVLFSHADGNILTNCFRPDVMILNCTKISSVSRFEQQWSTVLIAGEEVRSGVMYNHRS